MIPIDAILDALRRAPGVVSFTVGGKAMEPVAVEVSEKQFQQAVIDLARRNGWLVYHTRDSRKSESGFPDLVLLRAVTLIVAELKVGDNKPTAAQATWLEAFRAAGVDARLWYPESWSEIVAALQ